MMGTLRPQGTAQDLEKCRLRGGPAAEDRQAVSQRIHDSGCITQLDCSMASDLVFHNKD
jgi:hypothetical protein